MQDFSSPTRVWTHTLCSGIFTTGPPGKSLRAHRWVVSRRLPSTEGSCFTSSHQSVGSYKSSGPSPQSKTSQKSHPTRELRVSVAEGYVAAALAFSLSPHNPVSPFPLDVSFPRPLPVDQLHANLHCLWLPHGTQIITIGFLHLWFWHHWPIRKPPYMYRTI